MAASARVAVAAVLEAPNHYAALGCARDAPLAALRLCFLRTALPVHPDRPEAPEFAREAFCLAAEAWMALSDPEARRQYDAHLQATRSGALDTTACERTRLSLRSAKAAFAKAVDAACEASSADGDELLPEVLVQARRLVLPQCPPSQSVEWATAPESPSWSAPASAPSWSTPAPVGPEEVVLPQDHEDCEEQVDSQRDDDHERGEAHAQLPQSSSTWVSLSANVGWRGEVAPVASAAAAGVGHSATQPFGQQVGGWRPFPQRPPPWAAPPEPFPPHRPSWQAQPESLHQQRAPWPQWGQPTTMPPYLQQQQQERQLMPTQLSHQIHYPQELAHAYMQQQQRQHQEQFQQLQLQQLQLQQQQLHGQSEQQEDQLAKDRRVDQQQPRDQQPPDADRQQQQQQQQQEQPRIATQTEVAGRAGPTAPESASAATAAAAIEDMPLLSIFDEGPPAHPPGEQQPPSSCGSLPQHLAPSAYALPMQQLESPMVHWQQAQLQGHQQPGSDFGYAVGSIAAQPQPTSWGSHVPMSSGTGTLLV